jgi:hypothetical protein
MFWGACLYVLGCIRSFVLCWGCIRQCGVVAGWVGELACMLATVWFFLSASTVFVLTASLLPSVRTMVDLRWAPEGLTITCCLRAKGGDKLEQIRKRVGPLDEAGNRVSGRPGRTELFETSEAGKGGQTGCPGH